MKHLITRSIRVRPTVAMLAAMGMFWMGSTQGLHAQTERSDGEESSRSMGCSAAAVAGEWAYTEAGSVIPSSVAVPFAAVARYTLDAGGDLSGTATSSSGGTIANVTLKGTGTVNPDCTGTLTVGVYASGSLVRTATFDVVYVDGTREARAIIASLVLANGTIVPSVLTVDAKKVFERPLNER
jgi:hypothetical protein